jgi:hypothetical protein
MFKHGAVPEENRADALQAIRESFDNSSDDDMRQSALYMGGKPARPPKKLMLK